jgi:peptide chain release factor 2
LRRFECVFDPEACEAQPQNYDRWQAYLEEINTAIELLQIQHDASLIAEAEIYVNQLTDELHVWDIEQQLCQPYDTRNARLSIRAKNSDAADFAAMLFRMYDQWARRQGYKVKLVEEFQDGWGGMRSVMLEFSGRYAYGYLKSEDGVHALKQKPTAIRKNKRKERSQKHLILVEVVPIIDDEITIDIPFEHWEIISFQQSGNCNKIDPRVQVRHIPTGLYCLSTEERSPRENREKAIAFLKTKLFWIMQQHQLTDLSHIRGYMLEIDGHHPIRQYRLDSTPRIEDYRSGYICETIEPVLTGNIDDLLESCIGRSSWYKIYSFQPK